MLAYTTPQIDFILEMAAMDDPDNYTACPDLATWTDSLAGSALLHFMEKNRDRTRAKSFAGMKPGLRVRQKRCPASRWSIRAKSQ
jgi:hypothetical protein